MGREFIVEWTTRDENYDPKGASQQTSVKIYESSEGRVLAEDINLRLLEKSNRRVRLKVTTRSYPGAPTEHQPNTASWRMEMGVRSKATPVFFDN